jgi:hypothetical protein
MTSSDPQAPPPDAQPQAPRAAGFLQVLAAVFSSFLGIRKKAAGERDVASIKPWQVIAAGLLAAAALVGALVVLVSVVTRKG